MTPAAGSGARARARAGTAGGGARAVTAGPADPAAPAGAATPVGTAAAAGAATPVGTAAPLDLDAFNPRLALGAGGLLRAFNDAGALGAADVHVAARLARLGADGDERVLLGAAFAVRAPRLGHVCTDVATIRDTVAVDADVPADLQALPWPTPGEWLEALSSSPLVALGSDGPDDRPLRLVGSRLYLDRYWREERQVAADLRARASDLAPGVDVPVLAAGLARLFDGPEPDLQRAAAACAVLRRFAVVAGGPGTGKTTTVARILALVHDQARAAGAAPPLVALAAPTGKAAARLEEAVHEEAARLDVGAEVRERLLGLSASTLHRLLGWRPGNRARFRHDRANRLPHDVVVVDETSMVSLSLMARLVEAVRSGARLVLVGDPRQLVSVEAGAVLGDIVGPAAERLLMTAPALARLEEVCGQAVPASEPPAGAGVADGIVALRRVHRFGGAIAELAEAVRRGDADATVAVLREGGEDVTWLAVDVAGTGGGSGSTAGPRGETASAGGAGGATGGFGDGRGGGDPLGPVRRSVVAAGRAVVEAARAGRGRDALGALGAFRLLCAHRRGPHGVSSWTAHVERWLAAAVDGFGAGGAWYAGRPLLVTENDYGLRLYNGDTGVVVATGAGVDGDRPGDVAGGGDVRPGVGGRAGARAGAVRAVFERRGELLELSPHRLGAVDTVHAMTVHKAQGSQFDEVAVLLPDPASPILTRELLYTAVTRARRRLVVAGTEEAVRAAVGRPVARASGLREWLWGEDGT